MVKMTALDLFKGRHFDPEIIVLCVRWHLRFKLSSRDLVQMMAGARSWVDARHDSALCAHCVPEAAGNAGALPIRQVNQPGGLGDSHGIQSVPVMRMGCAIRQIFSEALSDNSTSHSSRR
jgi:hypothetical protein